VVIEVVTNVVSGAVTDLGELGPHDQMMQGQGGFENPLGACAVEFKGKMGVSFGHTATDYDLGLKFNHFGDDTAGGQVKADGNLPHDAGIVGQSFLPKEQVDQIIRSVGGLVGFPGSKRCQQQGSSHIENLSI